MGDIKTILIGGGSGLVGTRLTDMLMQKGYQVRHLGRKARAGKVAAFAWNIDKGEVDVAAFEGADVVINLAGANVNGRRWNDAYKKEMVDSRILSTRLLVQQISREGSSVQHFICGSAIGYYGFSDGVTAVTEESNSGSGFLAQLVSDWEAEAEKLDSAKARLSIVRTGIVMSKSGGALEAMAKPIRLMAGAALGTGRQVVSWIHIDDLCALFIYLIENRLTGIFNGVAPSPATNAEMTKEIARVLNKPLVLPNVPAFALRLILGEMAQEVVNGNRVSSKKIERLGFQFQFPDLPLALTDLLKG